MKYPTYSDYVKAKSDWIGYIPTHWEEWKARHGFGQIGSGTTPKSDNGLYYGGDTLWVTTAELRESIIFETANHVTQEAFDEHSALKKYPPGAVVIAMYGATIGRLGILGKEATVNQACCVFALPEKFEPRFFYYWLWMRRPVLISLSSGGGQPNLNQEELKRLRVPIPPKSEQQHIAAFLDWKTGQIDALIAKKRELIEKLKEKRLAVITQAVTRGLNPDAPLRDSGVPWLGEVPEHWEVKKLSRVTASRCDGPFGSGLKSEHYSDEGVRVIRLQNIAFAEFDDRDKAYIDPEYYSELGDHDVYPGDLLVAGLGDKNNPVGRACRAPDNLGPAMVKADCFRYRFEEDKADSQFMAYQMSITATVLSGALAAGVTRPRMNLSLTSDRVLAFPPIDEQIEIAKRLDDESERSRQMIAKIESAITHLTEYRTALITAAVTGKIDVRNISVPTKA
ncbi:MAG: restriction endonuclease subunit S [Bacteroidetes bacterium]|nr:restriction endonuclease subunit S [Bacteroidota bacterium]